MGESLQEKAIRAVTNFGDEQRCNGLQEGLRVAETIRGWLTRQPDTPEQEEVREWVDKLLKEKYAGIGIEYNFIGEPHVPTLVAVLHAQKMFAEGPVVVIDWHGRGSVGVHHLL